MNGLYAICDNKQCGATFKLPDTLIGGSNSTISFYGSTYGPCPVCGKGNGKILDGTYNLMDNILTFIKGPQESFEVLVAVKNKLESFQNQDFTQDQVISEVHKISSIFSAALTIPPPSASISDKITWLGFWIGIISLMISMQQAYFKPTDDNDLKLKVQQIVLQNEQNKIALENQKLLKENNRLLKTFGEKLRENNNKPRKKSERNILCKCGSNKKFKNCCGKSHK